MTATLRKSTSPAARSGQGFTRLEQVVMKALAQELRGLVPDLAAQFAASRLTVRHNSGFGVFTEVLAPLDRRPQGPTGEFGRVHVVIPDLPDPLTFRVRLRDGRLVGLLGDSQGQDTRAVDFRFVRFTQVFRVDDYDRPLALEVAGATQPASPPPAPAYVARPATSLSAAPAEGAEPQQSAGDLIDEEEKTTLRIGLWTTVFAIAAVLVLVFRMSFFVFIAAVFVGRFLQRDRGLRLVKRTLASFRQTARQEA